MNPSIPTTADTLTLTAVVKNQGPGVVQSPSSMTLQVGSEVNPPSYAVPPLALGNTQTITRTVSPLAAQNYVATATADSGGAIAESNEANNVTTLGFAVQGLTQRRRQQLTSQ
jgi:subtilase family serine protease